MHPRGLRAALAALAAAAGGAQHADRTLALALALALAQTQTQTQTLTLTLSLTLFLNLTRRCSHRTARPSTSPSPRWRDCGEILWGRCG